MVIVDDHTHVDAENLQAVKGQAEKSPGIIENGAIMAPVNGEAKEEQMADSMLDAETL